MNNGGQSSQPSNQNESIPFDLVVVVVLALVSCIVAVLPVVRETAFRLIFGVPLLVFLPGYAFVALLFPGEQPPDKTTDDRVEGLRSKKEVFGRIDGIERGALSIGTSVMIVSLIGLLLHFTPWGIQFALSLLSIVGFTVITAVIAGVRRRQIPQEDRFSVSSYRGQITGSDGLLQVESLGSTLLNVFVALGVLLALVSVAYAATAPVSNEENSDLYLLGEDDDGELVLDNYPNEFVQGEEQSLYVGINNNEHATVEYTVLVYVERIETDGDELVVTERQQVSSFEATLSHGESWHHEHALVSPIVGDDLRLTYLLYNGEPPTEPTSDNAYRETNLMIEVTEGDE